MKKILLILLSFMPLITLNATCDYNKYKEAKEYAKDIIDEISYSKSDKKFHVTISNLRSDMYVKYNNKKYIPIDGEIVINGVPQGARMNMEVYYESCDNEINILLEILPYYNSFYKSGKCSNYVGILTMCSSEFTASKVTESLVDLAIKNYNTQRLPVEKNNEVIVPEKTLAEKLDDFIKEWGLQIALLLSSATITYIIFNDKLRKTKHGV